MLKLNTTIRLNLFHKFILLLAFTIPLSQYVSSGLLVITVVFGFFLPGIKESLLRFLRNSWDLLLYILILLIGLTYSEEVTSGLRVLETNLSLLIVPLIFSRVVDLEDKKMHQIFFAFAVGLCLACVICLVNALIVYNETGNSNSFLFYSLTDVLNFQPTYFAYYLIFAITFGLYVLYYQKTEFFMLAKSVTILFLFFVLMLTGGQTAFISLLLIFAFFILKFLIEEKNSVGRLTFGLIVFMLLNMFVTTIVTKGERVETQLSDSWDRIKLWESAIDAVPNPLIGVGTGDYKSVLNQYYIAHGMEKYANESYNSHNQFIQILFSNGLIGVFSIILMIARPLYLSSKNENILAILVLFPFLIYGITEVFLGRYQGIVFFAFVHQLFVVQLNSKKDFLLAKPL